MTTTIAMSTMIRLNDIHNASAIVQKIETTALEQSLVFAEKCKNNAKQFAKFERAYHKRHSEITAKEFLDTKLSLIRNELKRREQNCYTASTTI